MYYIQIYKWYVIPYDTGGGPEGGLQMNAPGVAVGMGRGEGSIVGGWGVGHAGTGYAGMGYVGVGHAGMGYAGVGGGGKGNRSAVGGANMGRRAGGKGPEMPVRGSA
jgi:hypothetical protein